MSRARKLFLGLISALVLTGTLAGFIPSYARKPVNPPCDASQCDPNCTHTCSQKKRMNGVDCLFMGCLANGDCTYSCPAH